MPPGLFTRGLARQELEREFESHSLRQTVRVADKCEPANAKNREKWSQFCNPPLQSRLEKNVILPTAPPFAAFFSERHLGIPDC